MPQQLAKTDTALRLDKNYVDFLSGIKERLRTAQIRAAQAANTALAWIFITIIHAPLAPKKLIFRPSS